MFSFRPSHLAFLLMFTLLGDNCVSGAMTVQQMENAANGLRNVCIPKTGVDPALVAGTKKGEFPPDEKLQCYLKCIMGLIKTMKNGRPVLDTIIKQVVMMMPQEVHERNINSAKKCVAQDFGDNACVTAWQFVKCAYEADPEVFFFP